MTGKQTSRRRFIGQAAQGVALAGCSNLISIVAGAQMHPYAFWKKNRPVQIGSLSAKLDSGGSSGSSISGALDIGTAADNRYVIVFMFANDDGPNYSVSSFTVNGVAGTIAADHGGTSGSSNFRSPAIGIAKVPSGSGAQTVSVTWSESVNFNRGVIVLPVYGLSSTTALDSITMSDPSNTQIAGNLNMRQNKLSVLFGTDTKNGDNHGTTGLTEIYDQNTGDGASRLIIGCSVPTVTASVSVGYTMPVAGIMQFAAASFE